jgi:hypothetical protein
MSSSPVPRTQGQHTPAQPSLLQQPAMQPTTTVSPAVQSPSPLPFNMPTSSESQSQTQQSLAQPPPLQPTTTASQGPPSVPQFKIPGSPASLARKQQLPPQSPANPPFILDDFTPLVMPPDCPKRKRSQSGSSSQPQKPRRSTTARDQVSFSSTISLWSLMISRPARETSEHVSLQEIHI